MDNIETPATENGPLKERDNNKGTENPDNSRRNASKPKADYDGPRKPSRRNNQSRNNNRARYSENSDFTNNYGSEANAGNNYDRRERVQDTRRENLRQRNNSNRRTDYDHGNNQYRDRETERDQRQRSSGRRGVSRGGRGREADEYERRDGSDFVSSRPEVDYERSQRNNKREYRENDYETAYEKKDIEVAGKPDPTKTVEADSEVQETPVPAEDGTEPNTEVADAKKKNKNKKKGEAEVVGENGEEEAEVDVGITLDEFLKEGNLVIQQVLEVVDSKPANAEAHQHNIQGFKQLAKKEEFHDAKLPANKKMENIIFAANSNIVGLPQKLAPSNFADITDEKPAQNRRPDYGARDQAEPDRRRDFSRREPREGQRDFSRREPREGQRDFSTKRRVDGEAKGKFSCYNCGGEGHRARDCTSEAAVNGNKDARPVQKPRKTGACYNCGGEGHISRDCTSVVDANANGMKDARPTEPRKALACYNCGGEGHRARECTSEADANSNGNKDARPAQKPRKPLSCYNCGGEGHFSRDCTSTEVPKQQKITERKDTDRRAAPRYETRANPADNRDSDRRGPRGTETRDRGDNNYDRRANAKNQNPPTKSYGPSRNDNDGEKLPSTYNYKGKRINIDADFPELM